MNIKANWRNRYLDPTACDCVKVQAYIRFFYSKIWVQQETLNEMGADAFQADILSILAAQVALLTVF